MNLRLVSTKETLTWRRNLLDGNVYLAPENDEEAHYAFVDD